MGDVVLARQQDEEVLEQGGALDQPPRLVRHERPPVGLLGRLARRDDDLEVGRAAAVGADVEDVAVIHRLVAEAGTARRDQPRRGGGIAEVDDMRLRRIVAVDRDHRRAAEARGADGDEKGRIGFLEDLDVFALRRRQPMQHHPPRAMILVLLDIEEARRVGGPHRFAGGVLDAIGKVRFAGEVAHADRVHLRALVVGAPGELGGGRATSGRATGGRTPCPRRARRRRRGSSPCRRRAACGSRCGAGRHGGSANNRRKARRSAEPRCRPPSAAPASRARAGAAGRGSAPARRRRRRSPLRAGRGCRRAAPRGRAAPRASCRRGSRRSRRPRRRRGRGVARPSGGDRRRRRAALRSVVHGGGAPIAGGTAYCHGRAAKGRLQSPGQATVLLGGAQIAALDAAALTNYL